MPRGNKKGGAFERHLSKELSLWWTKGKRDDVFWRTSQSGGRATIRKKKGKKTFGQEGDLQATDPIGQPLIDLMTVEAKKGYNRNTCFDALDKAPSYSRKTKRMEMHPQQWEKFVSQSIQESKNAGVPFWMLIHRRDLRATVVYLSWKLYMTLLKYTTLGSSRPHLCITTIEGMKVFATTLEQFMIRVKPKVIKKLAKTQRKVLRIKRKK